MSTSAERNREPIRQALSQFAPASGTVLEIASGSGTHAEYLARSFPGLIWQPTDIDPNALASIRRYVADAGLTNLRPPIELDVTAEPWPVTSAEVVVCINMIHIAPWAATEGMFGGAGRILGAGGFLFTYGPYRFSGRFTAPSNADFDASLRMRDDRWGVRDIDELQAEAERCGLTLEATIDMPANNHSLLWRKVG